MKPNPLLLILFSLLLSVLHAQRDSAAVDTTSAGYRIGYEIGSWLPFLVIITLALMVIIRARNLSRKKEG